MAFSRPKCLSLLAFAVSLSLPLVAQAPAASAPAAPASGSQSATIEPMSPTQVAPAQNADNALRLGAGDLVSIDVFGVPDLKTEGRVSQSGDIYFPLIGKVHLAGATPEAAQSEIEQRLTDGGFLKSPHVSITIKEYATQGISVLGEVVRPGVYPLLGQPHLLDAITVAGGLTPRAARTISISRKQQNGQTSNITVELPRDFQNAGDKNVAINPGDMVVVPRAGVIYVVGEVTQPGGFILEGDMANMTVVQALAMSHGATKLSKLDSAKIIRRTADGRSEISVPLKKIMQAKAPDVAMQPDDILFVPASAGRNAFNKSMGAIVQISTGLAVRAPL